MKSKYYQALFLVGIVPVLAMAGVLLWLLMNQAPAAKVSAGNVAAVQQLLPSLQSQVTSLANSMNTNIQHIYADVPSLYAHNSDTDLDNFIKTHPGVTGIVVISTEGKLVKTIPASPPILTDPAYGASEEFQKAVERVKANPNKPYLFYTSKLGYPAFVFAVSQPTASIAEAVVSLAYFFHDMGTSGGELSLLDAGSGNYLYHTNPAKVGTNFNPNQEAWLSKIQTDLSNKQGGSKFNPDQTSGVWAPVFASFGIVHLFPSSILQPPSSPEKPTSLSMENLPQFFTSEPGTYLLIAVIACAGWIFIMGSLFFGFILSPLRKASGAILNAANGKGALTPDVAKRFGRDEVGQVVQASAMLLDKLEKEKQEAQQEKEEALRRGRAEVEAKSKEAADQVAAAQGQARKTQSELNDKNQQLNDKLKELDAMKGMADGLRNQAEQARAEIGKIKSQVASAEQAKLEVENSLRETKALLESQFKEMESKLMQAVSASSAIKVSQVRAAAIRTMSEELKTTLGIIKGYVSSALGTAAGGINEKQQEFLGMVINRSARLEKFINDLLDIYQVEIEQADAKPEEVNLSSEIEGLAFNFQAQADVKNIKMKVEARGTIPKIPIVRRRFNQLWNILYLQIIKDAPRGSQIPIEVEPLGGDMVKVTVLDPGLTVTPEALPRLFDEFYDPKHPASPQLAGTGLKFALVKTILASHGGGAVAEKADTGTRLVLTFPTHFKKPGEVSGPAPKMVAPSPSVTAPGVKPPVAATPPGAAGPRPLPPGMAPAAPRPGAPGLPVAPSLKPPALGVPTPGLKPPTLGVPGAPLVPGMPAAPGLKPPPLGVPAVPAPGAPPKPSVSAGGGVLDALISKTPAPTAAPAPGLKPPISGAPGIPTPPGAAPGMPAPKPPMPGVPVVPGMPAPPPVGGPTAPKPPVPGVPPMPGAPKPAGAGLFDALLDKKTPTPGAPPVPVVPPAPMAPKPIPPIGVPGMAPPPIPKPPMPGMPSTPGAPLPGIPVPGAPAAPKVVPTGLKPAPAPGVLDLESTDGPKLDAGAPKPAAPPGVPPKPMPGAPMPPPGVPKPAPGVPPGGLQATPPPKKDEGELIE